MEHPTSPTLLLLPSTAPVPSPFRVEAPPPARHLLATVQAPVSGSPDGPCRPLHFPHLTVRHLLATVQAPVSSTTGHADPFTMDHALCGPPSYGTTPYDFLFKNKYPTENASHFANNPCLYTESSRIPQKFQEDPWFLKINSNLALATFQKLQRGPHNLFSPYLHNHNSDFDDSCAKILRITSSFILCIH
jgi:hypothetical protein